MRCIVCKKELDEGNTFAYATKNWIHKCKLCLTKEKRTYAKIWRKEHGELSNARSRKHKEKMREKEPLKLKAYYLYGSSKKRAQQKGLEFNLTLEYLYSLLQKAEICPYLSYKLICSFTKADAEMSLDRKDSSKGYTKDNVQIISYKGNLMKSNATSRELREFAKNILLMHPD